MNTLLNRIVSAHYVITADQVQELASLQHQGVQATGTYLRVLVAVSRENLPKRRANQDAQLDAIDKTHTTLYGAVLRGVASPDADDNEVKRRAMFARSAVSTLRSYIKSGGDLKAINVEQVTKVWLYRATNPPEPVDRNERIVERAQNSLFRVLKRQAKADPDWAEEHIGTLIDELHGLLSTVSKPVKVVSAKLSRQPAAENRAGH